ncbi:exosortase [Sphingomonas gei]|uniref:exosortase n=1 Tax=Sphingomonas gei TaxID=1395960 RepID=UPI0014423787|nr:exosortase [Sphingomonas gei]
MAGHRASLESTALVPAALAPDAKMSRAAQLVLLVVAAAWLLPALTGLATRTWSTPQGAQGPIILLTGIWALWFEYRRSRARAAPGHLGWTILWFAVAVLLYVVARMIGMLSLACLAAWLGAVAALYGCVGRVLLRRLAFPLAYLLCLVPLPYAVEMALTGTLKTGVAYGSVRALAALGWDVAYSGSLLYIDQFELLVEAACAGLNSIFSLTAIGLFYIFWQRRRRWHESLILALAIVPLAIFANVVRVMLLIALVHWRGEQVLETAAHPAAGFLMFVVSLALLVALDRALPRRVESRRND